MVRVVEPQQVRSQYRRVELNGAESHEQQRYNLQGRGRGWFL